MEYPERAEHDKGRSFSSDAEGFQAHSGQKS